MKLYKNLVDAVAHTLQDIFKDKRYADKALERQFKQHPQWGSRDRRFIAEAVYDIVRYYRMYAHLAQSETNFWMITAAWLVLKEIDLPDWPEFKHINPAFIQKEHQRISSAFEIKESYPDWLIAAVSKELGEEKSKLELSAMNTTAPVFLRVNTLKCTTEKCAQALEAANIKVSKVSDLPQALQLVKRENVFAQPLFKEGWFEVQDAGSQLISLFVAPKPGSFVIDACAGAGGKSLHLAALMENKGKIISMDVEGWKLEELKKRSKRAGVHNIETQEIENSGSLTRFKEKADKLLLDVPCSGTGVLKRNPDAKWKLTPDIIAKTKAIQQNILGNYHQMLKPEGELIYSTCSILPSENEQIVAAFLAANSSFSLLEEKHVWPSAGTDGFYMARLRKSI